MWTPAFPLSTDLPEKETCLAIENANASSNRFNAIFTDVQFWVPVAVLIAGLLLLEWIR